MSLELVPSNSTFRNANTFTKQQVLNTPAANSEGETYWAQVVAHHRAPDVYAMIFGTEARPKMSKMSKPKLRLA